MSEITDEIMKLRFRGALIGALVGDCYGARYEHKSCADPTSLLEDIDKLSKGKYALKYTDDTAMSISTCKSLIENKGLDAKHLAKMFTETFFKEPKRGYGASVAVVFSTLQQTDYQNPFEPAAKQFNGQGSFGNGAAMRCVSVGLYANRDKMDNKSMIALSSDCARITHSHLNAINGATLLVAAVKYVLQLRENELDEFKFLDYLSKILTQIEPDGDKIYSQKLKTIVKVLENLNVSGQDIDQTEIVGLLGNDIAAQNSVPLAVYSFIRGNSKFNDSYGIENEFLRTLHWAISCGGDTDTIASMACGLCGAYVGLDRIPEALYTKCESWSDIIHLADQMFSHPDGNNDRNSIIGQTNSP